MPNVRRGAFAGAIFDICTALGRYDSGASAPRSPGSVFELFSSEVNLGVNLGANLGDVVKKSSSDESEESLLVVFSGVEKPAEVDRSDLSSKEDEPHGLPDFDVRFQF